MSYVVGSRKVICVCLYRGNRGRGVKHVSMSMVVLDDGILCSLILRVVLLAVRPCLYLDRLLPNRMDYFLFVIYPKIPCNKY